MKTLSTQVGDVICFEVPKKGGGATIRGCAINRGEYGNYSVHKIT